MKKGLKIDMPSENPTWRSLDNRKPIWILLWPFLWIGAVVIIGLVGMGKILLWNLIAGTVGASLLMGFVYWVGRKATVFLNSYDHSNDQGDQSSTHQ